jgi:hypothetical protein
LITQFCYWIQRLGRIRRVNGDVEILRDQTHSGWVSQAVNGIPSRFLREQTHLDHRRVGWMAFPADLSEQSHWNAVPAVSRHIASASSGIRGTNFLEF